VGEAGVIAGEITALLLDAGVQDRPFSPAAMASLAEFEAAVTVSPAGVKQWRVPAAEIAARRDYRPTLIMTIDPTTAKDLDDALHITVRHRRDAGGHAVVPLLPALPSARG
jgi:exoribonuclease R